MAKYIEFVGVAGVGKSTTYEFLRNKCTKKSSWVLYDGNFSRLGRWEVFKRSLKAIIHPYKVSRKCYNWQLLNRSFKENQELLKMFWEKFPENKNLEGKDLRFHLIHYILKILEKIQDVREERSDKWFLIDEGLIHNLNYFIPSSSNIPPERTLSRVLDRMCLPDAVVYFNADVHTVIQRTLSRSKKNPRDEELSLEELAEARIKSIKEKENFVKTLAGRKIPVLHVESSESVAEKTEKIISFINKLEALKEKKKIHFAKGYKEF